MNDSLPQPLDYSMKRFKSTDDSFENIVVSVTPWLNNGVLEDSGTENLSSSSELAIDVISPKVTLKVGAKVTGNVVAKINPQDKDKMTLFSSRDDDKSTGNGVNDITENVVNDITGNDVTGSGLPLRRCSLCPFSTNARRVFHYHRRAVHSLTANGEAVARLECPDCPYTCMYRSQLRKHRQRRHGRVVERLLRAPAKAEGIVRRDGGGGGDHQDAELRFESSRVYGAPGPFACPECSRPLAKLSGLQKHLRKVHRWTVAYACRRCSFSSGTALAVTHHGDKHHPDCDPRPFTCSECGHRARTQTDLRRHARTHTGERPHLCVQCGIRFSHGSNLKVHIRRMHTDDAVRKQ